MGEINKVGIISCSGEEIPAGTVSRLATRRVLELLRPQSTVTLCLPLFLAGEEMERRFAREHPTITVDGCDKLCAKRGTETYSGQVAASLVVTDILGDKAAGCHRSLRDVSKIDEEAVWIVAKKISEQVDVLLASIPHSEQIKEAGDASCACSCGTPAPEITIQINGKTVAVNGLHLIFEHLHKQGLEPTNDYADRVLDTVRIYHFIEPAEENFYRDALAAAYRKYCQH
ncbi:MAG: putative zinc-binding protein [Thermoguttaceae bacterium]|jgi:uncharacterized metal-binding protein